MFAGVGKPIKDDDCRASKLNLANRNKEKKGIINPARGIKTSADLKIRRSFIQVKKSICVFSIEKLENDKSDARTTIIITPGATPNVTMSAKESNCFPNSPEVLNIRAKKPSRKSKIAPKNIEKTAKWIFPVSDKIIAKTPEIKFAEVNKLARLNIHKKKCFKKSTISFNFTSYC